MMHDASIEHVKITSKQKTEQENVYDKTKMQNMNHH